MKIFNLYFKFRSHWATKPNGEKIQMEQKGVIVLHLEILDNRGGIITAPVDTFYGLAKEGEALLSYKKLPQIEAALKYKMLGVKLSHTQLYRIDGGSGWRLHPEITKAIRNSILGAPEVPVSPEYLKKVEAAYKRRPTENSKFLELRDNPQLPPEQFWRKFWGWVIEGDDLVLPR